MRNDSNDLEDAKDELLKYIQAFLEKYPNRHYLGIANDGLRFRVYQPIVFDNNNKTSALELIDTIDLEKASTEDVFLWFDSYLFTSTRMIPSSKDIKKRFGLESPTFASFRMQLNHFFKKVQHEKRVNTKYDNWTRFLEIIYGDKVHELDLFLKHTYLSTFAKLLVHLKLSGHRTMIRKDLVLLTMRSAHHIIVAFSI